MERAFTHEGDEFKVCGSLDEPTSCPLCHMCYSCAMLEIVHTLPSSHCDSVDEAHYIHSLEEGAQVRSQISEQEARSQVGEEMINQNDVDQVHAEHWEVRAEPTLDNPFGGQEHSKSEAGSTAPDYYDGCDADAPPLRPQRAPESPDLFTHAQQDELFVEMQEEFEESLALSGLAELQSDANQTRFLLGLSSDLKSCCVTLLA